MATVTLPSLCVKAMLAQFVDKLTFSKSMLRDTIQQLESLQSQYAPTSLDSCFQDELNSVHLTYQCTIALAIQNIKAQHHASHIIQADVSYELGQSPDRQYIRTLIKRISQELDPLEQNYQNYKQKMQELACRISILTKGLRVPNLQNSNMLRLEALKKP